MAIEQDYLSTKDAAKYMCVSLAHFYVIKKAADLRPIRSFGKNLYKKQDLIYLIEHAADYEHALDR